MFKFLVPAFLILAACAQAPIVTETPARRVIAPQALPAMKVFPAGRIQAPTRSNAELTQDFLDLSFRMESGRELGRMSRFEGQITVRATGQASQSLQNDLGRLLDRIRREAGIDIRGVPSGDITANITIEALPRRDLQRLVPQAACFVVPNITSWADYKRARRSSLVDWTRLTTRETVAIFVPSDVAPQEIRDCLHEELAQAIGPLNDLYRLPDSVFNDDNFHAVLTGFDMLMLRTYYAPELRAGMTRDEAARVVPQVLARLNPAGNRPGGRVQSVTSRRWIDDIEKALGPRASNAERRIAAQRAVVFAESQGWRDNRYAFSLFALGRLSLSTEPELALASFLHAGRIFAANPDTQLHAAHVAMQMAAFGISAGQSEETLRLIDTHLNTVAGAENAALLSTLLMMKAEVLEQMGRKTEAKGVRLDAIGWARYGFGSERQVRARLSEIAALSPRPGRI